MNEEKIPFFSYNSDTQKFWILGKIVDTKEEVDKCICTIIQENKQLNKQLQQKEDIINKAREYIYEHARIDDEYPAYIEMLLEEKNELLEILDRKE